MLFRTFVYFLRLFTGTLLSFIQISKTFCGFFALHKLNFLCDMKTSNIQPKNFRFCKKPNFFFGPDQTFCSVFFPVRFLCFLFFLCSEFFCFVQLFFVLLLQLKILQKQFKQLESTIVPQEHVTLKLSSSTSFPTNNLKSFSNNIV